MDEIQLKRWREIDTLFDEVLRRDVDERTAYLRAVCGNDTELYREVLRLLESATQAESSIGESIDDFAGDLLDGLIEYIDSWDEAGSGTRVGPYRLTKLLGKGGMGIVYLAERADGNFEQQVALKIVKRGMDTDEVVKRFISERQLLASLDHPGIARLIDGGVTGDSRPYLVMEFIDGEPINSYADGKRLTIRQRLNLFQQVCDVVSYAHRNLVIHRDLKPSNILVTRDGNVRLLDFGVAKLLSVGEREWTRTGLRMMTPAYASPEQLQGRTLTTASDVYQLGILLHELLVGVRPEAMNTGAESAQTHRPSLPSAIARSWSKNTLGMGRQTSMNDGASTVRNQNTARYLWRELKGDLDTIVTRALHPEPDRRYSSAEALSADIERHLEGLPILARADSIGYRLGKFVQRNRTAVLSIAGVIFLLTGLVLFHIHQLGEQRDRAKLQALRAQTTMTFLENMFEGADPEVALGDTMSVFDLLDRGTRALDVMEDVPESAAQTRLVLGRLHFKLGDAALSRDLLEDALTSFLNLGPEFRSDAAQAAMVLGEAFMLLGDHGKADEHFSEAIELHRSQGRAGLRDLADDLIHYGVSLEQMGRYSEAREMIQEARQILDGISTPDEVLLADAAYALASVEMNEGEYETAESLMWDALATYRVHRDVPPSKLANALNNLGNLLADTHDFDGAEALLHESIEIRKRLFGDDHPIISESYNNLAFVPYARGNYARADSLFRLSLAIVESRVGRNNRSFAMTLSNLGWIHMAQNEVETAEVTFKEALKIMEAASGSNSADAALLLGNVGTALQRNGRLEEAEHYLRRALEVRTEIHGLQNIHVAWRTYAVAELLRTMGRSDEALDLHRASVDIRRTVRGDEHFDTARGLVALGENLVELGRKEEARSILTEALSILEITSNQNHPEAERAEEALAQLD